MPVSLVHPLYAEMSPVWRECRDAVAGQRAVKKGGALYLPATFAEADPVRYAQYLQRAYFMGVTGRTKEALTGMVFRKSPRVVVPPQIEPFLENIDGAGQSLEQLAKEIVGDELTTGRYVLLVDYPSAPEGIDSEAERMMGLRPTVAAYAAESLINWRFEGVNGRKLLTLAVLAESVETGDDEFSHDTVTVYRVLRLRKITEVDGGTFPRHLFASTDHIYTQALYDQSGNPITEEYTPRMAGGARFNHIPLHIIGAVNNLPEPGVPPLYDMAVLNISHYRNTADLEESSFISGQPTVHLSIGETDAAEWQQLNPNGLQIGSRAGVITKGGSMELVQADATALPFELMKHKEAQMVAIGARLVQRGGQAETAEAARLNASAEASTLDNVVGNVSEGIEAALEDMCRFVGADPEVVEYALSREFWETNITAQDLQAVLAGVGTLYGPMDALEMIRTGSIKLRDDRDNETILQDAAGTLLVDDIDPAELGLTNARGA